MQNGERIETLTRLGLTLNQARLYLSLVHSGPATAKEISKASGITRQDIYRVIPTLQKIGIVEKAITSPATFKAIPVEQVLAILLRREVAQHRELQKKTKELLLCLKDTQDEKPLQEKEEANFVLIPEKDVLIERLRQAIQQAQQSVDIVASRKVFVPTVIEFAEAYSIALKRGTKIRIATEGPLNEKAAQETTDLLRKNPNFEVKYFLCPPRAVVAVIDDKDTFLMVSPTARIAETQALWSKNDSFLDIVKNYFEDVWNMAGNKDQLSATLSFESTAKETIRQY